MYFHIYRSTSPSYLLLFIPWGGVSSHEQRSSSRSRRGGVSENQIAGAAAARLFFLTAVAIAIATRPFKFHEISVTNTSSSFVSSIHSLGCRFSQIDSQVCADGRPVLRKTGLHTQFCAERQRKSTRQVSGLRRQASGPGLR